MTEVLQAAEQGKWQVVQSLIEKDAKAAQAQDEFLMLPLHWACTEPQVPESIFQTILQAYPDGTRVRNLSGMLPLHVAIKAVLPGKLIQHLLDVYPEGALQPTTRGLYAIELAEIARLPEYTCKIIRKKTPNLETLHAHDTLRKESAGSASTLTDIDEESNQTEEEEPQDGSSLERTKSYASCRGREKLYSYESMESIAMLSSPTSKSLTSQQTVLQLQELKLALNRISTEIRSSASTSSTGSFSWTMPYRGSNNQDVKHVLWNPKDRLGLTFRGSENKKGAVIAKISSKSDALGADSLAVGDVLLAINDTSVANTSLSSIQRFLKHAKVTCKLCFAKSFGETTASGYSNPVEESSQYNKLQDMLERTMSKVSSVEQSLLSQES